MVLPDKHFFINRIFAFYFRPSGADKSNIKNIIAIPGKYDTKIRIIK